MRLELIPRAPQTLVLTTDTNNTADLPRFELRQTGPKPVVLPLYYKSI